MTQSTNRSTPDASDDLLPITCPECGHQWWTTYRELQRSELVLRTVYRAADAPPAAQAAAPLRQEEYLVRCPNLRHGELVVVTVAVEEE